MTQAEYLTKQAQDAKAAIAATAKSALGQTARVADPRRWAKSHPWATVAATAVAGFAAAVAAVPSRQQQELRRLVEYERLTARLRPSSPKPNGDNQSDKSSDNPRGAAGWVILILKELLAFARPMLTALLASHLNPATGTDQSPQSSPDRAGDGHGQNR